MSEASTIQPAKPGTACIGCRRRKLKCSRESDGCSNCRKSDLPCVYPAPESTGIKRKRGPYKKDKPPRERHLEDLVKYLEPKPPQSSEIEGNDRDTVGFAAAEHTNHAGSLSSPSRIDQNTLEGPRSDDATQKNAGSSEDLVKDALIALTRSSVADREAINEFGTVKSSAAQASSDAGGIGVHPPVARVFAYWELFVSRVDPLTKVIHCPTFAKTFLYSIDNLRSLGPATEALLFSVYYAAVSTCTAREARHRFNDSREVLLQRYGRSVEAALADNYSIPVLESLQALVIYMIAIRREDNITNVRALFSLSVRMAQLMGLQNDPGQDHSPYEAELRRRIWWQICGLESRGAEEGGARSHSIMEGCSVALPANLLDFDLHPESKTCPQSRAGCTDMSFVLLRFETMRMVQQLCAIRNNSASKSHDDDPEDLKSKQRKSLEESKLIFETHYLRYFDQSRPYDWLCIKFAKTMLLKARLIIDHPFGRVPSKQMTSRERFNLLQTSVDIIALTHVIESHKGAEPWIWYFRGWTQWHSLAIVVFELGKSTNQQFATHAWSVLDPLLSRWDKIYSAKRDEPAWDHVNALIERARQTRQQNISLNKGTSGNNMQSTFQDSTLVEPVSQMPNSNGYGQAHIQQLDISAMTGDGTQLQPYPSMHHDSGRASDLRSKSDVPFQTGCAPVLIGFEEDFGSFDGLDSIDFSAFDAVFGDSSWEFSSPNTDWSLDSMNP